MIKIKKLSKLECTPLRQWDLIAFVLVGLASPFIYCYWYLVAVNWGVRDAFPESFKVPNSGAVELWTVQHMNIHSWSRGMMGAVHL